MKRIAAIIAILFLGGLAAGAVEPPECAQGSIDLLVETEDEADVREQVFELCSSNHFPILLMSISEMTLEDIFLQITGEREA